ncbi:MAG: hypothetical protein OEW64_01700 [Gammaproteobacteria bacterium]|nr:hypothetical protein [Gammaproteobacteria bacterium]MDH5302794.1 hypothetical protein [Gammaproteobacteria bacterium]MDH5322354.1 hypothetical protein [Gammaproteobacteria bacterium]
MLKPNAMAIAIAAALLPGAASAHHGLDFLTVQTAHLPMQGTAYAIARADYISEHEDELEFAPAMLYGATDWMAFELHAHFEKEQGDSAHYESLAPALHFRLTPRDNKFSLGISAEYEIASDNDAEDVLELAGILGYEASGWTIAANLLFEKASGEESEWGFAAGARRSLKPNHYLGLELIGSLQSNGPSELLLGYYGDLSTRFSINAALGTGLDDGPDWSARTAFIWRFR